MKKQLLTKLMVDIKRKFVFISFVLVYFGVFIVFILLPLSCSKDDNNPSLVPELTTDTISTITPFTANCGGNIISNGGETVTARGVCWSVSHTSTVSDNKTNDGNGVGKFTSEMSGLTPETKYYVRAYATNSIGTGYGNELSFTTEQECELLCDIGTESYSIGISCESGSTITTYNGESTEYQYDSFSRLSGLKLNLNRTRTYENTNNTYTIVGVIEVDLIQDTETHDITVSGGKFTDPQTCN
jgi:YD repeat-containing protein